MNDRDGDIEKLIKFVEERPILYDKSRKDYKNEQKKNDIWKGLTLILDSSASDAKSRFAGIRNGFTAWLRHLAENPSTTRKKYKWADALEFLVPHVNNKKINAAAETENDGKGNDGSDPGPSKLTHNHHHQQQPQESIKDARLGKTEKDAMIKFQEQWQQEEERKVKYVEDISLNDEDKTGKEAVDRFNREREQEKQQQQKQKKPKKRPLETQQQHQTQQQQQSPQQQQQKKSKKRSLETQDQSQQQHQTQQQPHQQQSPQQQKKSKKRSHVEKRKPIVMPKSKKIKEDWLDQFFSTSLTTVKKFSKRDQQSVKIRMTKLINDIERKMNSK